MIIRRGSSAPLAEEPTEHAIITETPRRCLTGIWRVNRARLLTPMPDSYSRPLQAATPRTIAAPASLFQPQFEKNDLSLAR